MKKILISGLLVLVLLQFWGCATTQLQQGQKYTEDKDYESALATFEAALEEGSEDSTKIMTEMGVTYFKTKEVDKAFPLLLKSFIRDTTNDRAIFYLALIYEIHEKYPYAVDMYTRYYELSTSNKQKKRIQARMTQLARKRLRQEMRATINQEEKLSTASLDGNSVAVFYFKNAGNNEKLNPLQKGLADMLITDLSKVKQLNVVERLKLQTMMDEMKLSMTGLLAKDSSPRFGKLLGASKIIQGTYMDLPEAKFQIDAGLVEVKTIKPMQMASVKGELLKFFEMEKDLVFKVIDEMDIEISQEERDAIQIIPTENLLAFMAYCRGLDYEDKGMWNRAVESYGEAVNLDPGFGQAQQNLSQSEEISEAGTEVAEFEVAVMDETPTEEPSEEAESVEVAEEEPEQEVQETDVDLTSQMVHTGEVMTQIFLPGVESREPVQEQATPSFGNSASFRIIIPIPADARR